MDLDKLRIFYYVAQAKSFTNSALNLSPSAISRHISDLEYRLKVSLFHRQARGLVLTEQGEILLTSVQKIFTEIETARTLINELAEEPQGVLRLAVPSGWSSVVLVKYVSLFTKRYKKMQLKLISCDLLPDFGMNTIDAAILPRQPDRPNLVQRYLTSIKLKLYASPDYLAEHGVPQDVQDLDHHRLISFGDHNHYLSDINWHLKEGKEVGDYREPSLSVLTTFHAAEEGLGIATLAKENPLLLNSKLVEVLPNLEGPEIKGYYVVPEHLKNSKRIKLFGDFLEECIQNDKVFQLNEETQVA